ncbi:MAG: hypothetical protein LUE27_11870 [Clostridia bacterium]|nr:hypothetical protein [Clostridia bacterium]
MTENTAENTAGNKPEMTEAEKRAAALARKKKRIENTKRFFKDLFTQRVGLKLLAIVLAFVLVILLNV